MNRKSNKKERVIAILLSLTLIFSQGIQVFAADTEAQSTAKTTTKFSMTWYDVGAGDCSVIRFPNGKVAVIDAGTPSNGKKVAAKLSSSGITTIDYLVSTHPDADHCGGLIYMFSNFDVKNFYYPDDAPYDTKTAASVMESAFDEGCKMINPEQGYKIRSGDVTLKFVQPDMDYSTDNEDSLALYIDYEKLQILTCGDAEKGVGDDIQKHNVDILQLPHHGSKYATSASVIRRFDPERVVVSTDGKKYGHPNKEVFQRLKSYDKNIKVHRTDKQGDITVTATSSGWKFNKTGVSVSKYTGTSSNSSKPSTGSTSSKPSTGSSTASQTTVYITPTGSKYHLKGCSYLSRSKYLTKMKKSTAKANGYTPCSRCF